MGTNKELTYDSAKAQLGTKKEELKAKREELLAWLKEKGLKKSEDHSKNENEKIAKKFTRLTGEIKALEEETNKLRTFVKENKPKKERTTKYQYPEGATADEKKKIRQKNRVAAKQAGVSVAEYLENPAKYKEILEKKKKEKEAKAEEKAKKKEKKAEAPAEGEKKKKKKPVVAKEEDDDED